MDKLYISFYLRSYRIHVTLASLRKIGCPERICFLLNKEQSKIAIMPYKKRDFKSHKVPKEVYHSQDSLEISSFRLCQIMANTLEWDLQHSYRVPGAYNSKLNMIFFSLSDAEKIEQ